MVYPGCIYAILLETGDTSVTTSLPFIDAGRRRLLKKNLHLQEEVVLNVQDLILQNSNS
jgi:hypothetical protein